MKIAYFPIHQIPKTEFEKKVQTNQKKLRKIKVLEYILCTLEEGGCQHSLTDGAEEYARIVFISTPQHSTRSNEMTNPDSKSHKRDCVMRRCVTATHRPAGYECLELLKKKRQSPREVGATKKNSNTISV